MRMVTKIKNKIKKSKRKIKERNKAVPAFAFLCLVIICFFFGHGTIADDIVEAQRQVQRSSTTDKRIEAKC